MAELQSDQIEINRRVNAQELARKAGSKARFAARIGRSPGQINQTIGPNPTKNIGKVLAREIERAFGKPTGWLDNDNTEGASSPAALAEAATIFANFDDDEAVEVIKTLLRRLDRRHQIDVLKHLASALPDDP